MWALQDNGLRRSAKVPRTGELRPVRKTIFFAMAVAVLPSIARADATIKYSYMVRAVRIDPDPQVTTGTYQGSLVLRDDGQVSNEVTALGAAPKQFSRKGNLGGSTEDTQFRVIDEHTIRRSTVYPTYTFTLTIHVDGKTCAVDAQAQLNPGNSFFLAYSPRLGRNAKFSSSEMVSSTCDVR